MSRYYRVLMMAFSLVIIMTIAAGLEAFIPPSSMAKTPTPTRTPTPTKTPNATTGNCIPLDEAMKKGLVQMSLASNGGPFWTTPLHYQIQNLTDKALKICVPAGMIFNPDDSSFQSLMVVKTVIIDLAPKETKEGDLSADCINEKKHAPDQGIVYKFGKMAQGKLLSLANTIDAESAQGHWGTEFAIWAVTDNFTLNDLGLGATPDPNQPSLMASIEPLLCLTQDDVNLGQKLLQDAQTSLTLYSGDNPLTSYCQSQGIPSLSQIGQRLKILGIQAGLILGAGILGCIVVVALVIILAIRLFRKPKAA